MRKQVNPHQNAISFKCTFQVHSPRSLTVRKIIIVIIRSWNGAILSLSRQVLCVTAIVSLISSRPSLLSFQMHLRFGRARDFRLRSRDFWWNTKNFRPAFYRTFHSSCKMFSDEIKLKTVLIPLLQGLSWVAFWQLLVQFFFQMCPLFIFLNSLRFYASIMTLSILDYSGWGKKGLLYLSDNNNFQNDRTHRNFASCLIMLHI